MSETDRRLKDKLNGNLPARERMCIELLATEKKFSNVRPRLPNGGPDGGRDIEADYNENERALGAVGFVNNATDTTEHRKSAKKKFLSDLKCLNKAGPDYRTRVPTVFVFFTNVGLTPKIISELQEAAYANGVTVCEIYDRERIRLMLDRSTGYGIRIRYLDIPLSDPEQKEFFADWGERVQELMTSSLPEISRTTRRLNFLAEAQFPVDSITTIVQLKKPLGEISGGNFLFQTTVILRAHVDGLIGMSFGSANSPIIESIEEIRKVEKSFPRNHQYGYGCAKLLPGTDQYARYMDMTNGSINDDEKKWFPTNSSTGILEIDKLHLRMEYGGEPFLMRFYPTCKLIDLDGAMILFDCNADIAEHIDSISIYANYYCILDLNSNQTKVESGAFSRFTLPEDAHQSEATHLWRVIRPSNIASCFSPDFIGKTPRRLAPIDM